MHSASVLLPSKTIAFEHLQDEYGKLYYCQIPNRGIELHHKPRLDIF